MFLFIPEPGTGTFAPGCDCARAGLRLLGHFGGARGLEGHVGTYGARQAARRMALIGRWAVGEAAEAGRVVGRERGDGAGGVGR